MDWTLEDRPEAVIVEMTSHPVNKQNPAFLADLHRALDVADAKWPDKPLVLTGKGKVFSAGLDLDYVFPLFERGPEAEVAAWFADYRRALMRVFRSPRLTIAALNGHAFAGGLVLALCCDFRITLPGDSRFALNEVPIGIPMPSVYTEIIRFRLGNRVATEAVLLGRAYSVEESRALGILTVAESGSVVEAALEVASEIPRDSWPAYAQSKRALLHPVLERIDRFSDDLEKGTFRVMMAEPSIRRQKVALERLKKKDR